MEVALLPHHVLEKRDLAFVDEETELACLFEVDLGGEEGQRFEWVVPVAGERCGRRGEQRSAQAIADPMDTGVGNNGVDGH